MNVNKTILFVLVLILHSCNGQNKENPIKNKENKMVEKFDFDEYNKRESATHIVNRNNEVVEMVFIENKFGTYKIVPDKPSFKTVYKEFYANGNIKKKEIFIGERTKIDTSEYYDEKGNLEKIDENKKFGDIKPNDVLKFLEQKKIINISTGNGRFDEDGRPTFEIQFDENKKEYFITIFNGKPNTGPWDDIGEPPAFIPVVYKMNGETGKVEETE